MNNIEKLAAIYASIQRHGLAVNRTSRIGNLERLLHQPRVASQDPNHPDNAAMIEAVRDLQELHFIFCGPAGDIPHPELAARFQMLNKDSPVATQDRSMSKGRDTQWEMLLYSAAHRCGFMPSYAEPDIVISRVGGPIGLAAKRVKSLKTMKDRVCDAADQIRESKLPGIILAEVSMALSPDAQWVSGPVHVNDWLAATRAISEQFRGDFEPKIKEWTRGSWTIGALFATQYPRFDPVNGWGLEGGWIPIPLSDNQNRSKRFERVYDGIVGAFPNALRT